MEKVVIVGGGVSGLVANYVFKLYDQEPIVLEPGKPGGEFNLGGLKYIHYTKHITDMFDHYRLPWSDYRVRGGIVLRGEVHDYPKCLRGMSKAEALRVQEDHFRKTRRTEPGRFGTKAMNDPAAKSSRRAVRCNFEGWINAMAEDAVLKDVGAKRIESKQNRVVLSDDSVLEYDRLIVTLPLWITRRIADFDVPEGLAMNLNLLMVYPFEDNYARWDYVYTPYTPHDAIHRFSEKHGGYSVEVNGNWDESLEARTFSDLNYLFNKGYKCRMKQDKDGELIRDANGKPIVDVARAKGHLLELDWKPEWPGNVYPLGRFAQWDPRQTTDVTLERAHTLAESWGWIPL